MTAEFDLLIIGGGALGTFHAYHALNQGLKVALFERHERPRSATTQNFGQVVPSGMNLKWQAYGRRSLAIYKELQQQTDISLSAQGSVYLASNADELTLLEELHQINLTNDYPSQLLTRAACYARYPKLHPSYCCGGLFFPEEVSINPRLMIHRVQQKMEQDPKFSFYRSTLIQSIDSSGATCVAYDHCGARYTGALALVCSGTEFEALYPTLFAQSDLVLVKLQMMRLKPQPTISLPGNILTGLSIRRYESFHECPSFSAIKAKEHPDSFWKKWGIHILFKQEADGSIILGDSHEYADIQQKDQLDFYLREEISQYFLQEAAKIVQLDHWMVDQHWLGYYTQSKTQDLFRHTIDNKVHILTGIGGKGMTASAGYTFENLNKILGQ